MADDLGIESSWSGAARKAWVTGCPLRIRTCGTHPSCRSMIVRRRYGAALPLGPSILVEPRQCARMMLPVDSSTVGSLMNPGRPLNPCRIMWVMALVRSDSQMPPKPRNNDAVPEAGAPMTARNKFAGSDAQRAKPKNPRRMRQCWSGRSAGLRHGVVVNHMQHPHRAVSYYAMLDLRSRCILR